MQIELLEELGRLSILERLDVLEATLRLIRQDLQQLEQLQPSLEIKHQLTAAAEALLPDYTAGDELTIFTVLDGEGFYAQE